MNRHFSNEKILNLTKVSVVLYLLLFQAWRVFQDYPAGVLSEEYKPVGIFHLLPGPVSEPVLDFVCYLWPVFLILALTSKYARVGLFGSFILGCYVLGYSYNFGRIFHGTSLILQVLLVLALGTPSRRDKTEQKEAIAAVTVGVVQLLVCLAYFASGIAKVWKSGPAWALSENLAVILHTQPLVTALQGVLLSLPPSLLQAVATFVFLIELTSLLPFFFKRVTGFYVVSWMLLHIGIGLTLGGHSTFFSHLFIFPVFLGSVMLGASGFEGIKRHLFVDVSA